MSRRSDRRFLALVCLALLTVITALVAGLENDDLVFDHDSKVSTAEVPAEQESGESLFHSIWNWLNLGTETLSLSKFRSSGQFDKSVDTNSILIADSRRKREIKEDNEIINDDTSYKSRKSEYKDDSSIQPKLSQKYTRQGDDEDDIGSGEPEVEREEGSANSVDFHTTRPTTEVYTNLYTNKEVQTRYSSPTTESNLVDLPGEFEEKNVFRISMTIKEPYREEFERRDGEKFQKFAENVTKSVEEILHRHLRKDQHVTFVKVENAPDPFESHVDLDIHTMSGESEVRNALEKHVNTYYSLGKFTVNPLTFRLRAVVECQLGEIACDVSRCILQSQRCDFKRDCADGSDEADCKYPDDPL